MKIRVLDIACPSKTDIDVDKRVHVSLVDGHVKRCVAAVTDTLKHSPAGYSDLQTAHVRWIFDAMGFTHVTIRNLLAEGTKAPACVDALVLARLQLEALYSICLMVQDPAFIDIYVKRFWRDAYVRFLLEREERKGLARFDEYINQRALPLIEDLRRASGVTDDEKATVETEELGIPLSPGMTSAKIGTFPTPMGVIEKITDAGRKKMLMRLYPEYRRLCAFAQGSAQAWMWKTAFWERSPLRPLLSDSQRQDHFEKEIADPALLHSLLAVVQGTCEVATLYRADIELNRTAIEAWNLLSEMNLLGRTIWEIRGKSALGVI
ncbi:MAG TPA: hypothetical protein VGG46_08470 [Terriglobales bacterium]|jgi:hypothetical protein